MHYAIHTLRIKHNTINVEVEAMFKIKDDKIETENKNISNNKSE